MLHFLYISGAGCVTCADCAIWARVTDDFGICRRFPPIPLLVPNDPGQAGSMVRMFWSETRPGAWCAEHRPAGPLDRTEGNA